MEIETFSLSELKDQMLATAPKEKEGTMLENSTGDCIQLVSEGQCSRIAKCGFKHVLE